MLNAKRQVLIIALAILVIHVRPGHGQQKASSLDDVHAFLKQAVEDDLVAGGAVLVHFRGETILHTGFGYADKASKKPFSKDAPVIVASISKPMLGTTLYRLVEKGKLDPDLAISEYLPEFENRKLESGKPLERAPTLTELLTHTAGLRSDEDPEGRIWYQSWTSDQTLSFVVKKIAGDFPFKRNPGTKRAYSGIGTEIAARIGEHVSGETRNDLLQIELAKPLGMKNTFYRDRKGFHIRPHLTMPTRYYRSKKTGKLIPARKRKVTNTNRYNSSGGNVISTTSDLLTWLLMIRNQGKHRDEAFLKPETIQSMIKPHKVGNFACGGLAVRAKNKNGQPTVLGHTGSSGTSIVLDLENDLISIILTQTSAKSDKGFRKELEKRIRAAVILEPR